MAATTHEQLRWLAQIQPGPLYCVIMTHPLEQPRRDLFVLLTTRPLAAVAAHNRRRARDTSDTSDVAPYWYPVFVAGPFWFEETAVGYANDVMYHTRGVVSKCRRARALAAKYGVPCYVPDVPPPPPTSEAAARYRQPAGAPAALGAAFAAYECAAAVLDTYLATERTGDGNGLAARPTCFFVAPRLAPERHSPLW